MTNKTQGEINQHQHEKKTKVNYGRELKLTSIEKQIRALHMAMKRLR